jgi:DNA-binding NtrC family response regulator
MANRSKAAERLRFSEGPGYDARGVQVSGAADATLALRAAQAPCTLLITGETGVGKGFLARWIHEHGARRDGPFIPVNCGAIPETLIDSQLFGHARGAFSGATADHLGLVRAAEHGTLLLDEVSELPPSAQTRLLHLLADREVQPVGHSRPIVVDVRVIAATNVDLRQAVTDHRFREDLLFRLDVIQLHVRPLRERRHQLPDLISQFNVEFARLYRRRELEFDQATLDLLSAYHWPGNVRQLRTLIERLHVLCPGDSITIADVLELGHLHPPPRLHRPSVDMDQLKLEHVRRVLSDSGGSITRAAEAFGVHRSTIYRWLRGN